MQSFFVSGGGGALLYFLANFCPALPQHTCMKIKKNNPVMLCFYYWPLLSKLIPKIKKKKFLNFKSALSKLTSDLLATQTQNPNTQNPNTQKIEIQVYWVILGSYVCPWAKLIFPVLTCIHYWCFDLVLKRPVLSLGSLKVERPRILFSDRARKCRLRSQIEAFQLAALWQRHDHATRLVYFGDCHLHGYGLHLGSPLDLYIFIDQQDFRVRTHYVVYRTTVSRAVACQDWIRTETTRIQLEFFHESESTCFSETVQISLTLLRREDD